MPTVIVGGPTYFSPGDEDAFFSWLQAIPAVVSVGGRARDLHIELKPGRLEPEDARELAALFRRYGLDPSTLPTR